MTPAASLYFETGNGRRCTSCHEMQPLYDHWANSSHRGIACGKCHGDAFTTDVSFHMNNAQRAWSHLRGDLPEQIGFANRFALAMNAECQNCHRQEYATWQAGPHSATYARIFLDKKHNAGNMLMDDCLRCHGMQFEGGMGDLVTPIDRKGPWRLTDAKLANMPSIPCVTCHEVHRAGKPMNKAGEKGTVLGPSQEITRPSLALFDRRTGQYIPVAELPAAGDVRRHPHGEDEQGPAPGPLLPVPCSALDRAGGQRRRPHRNGRPRRHQLPGLPCAARRDYEGFVRQLPS